MSIVAKDPLFYTKAGKALATSALTSASADGVTIPLDGIGAEYLTFVLIADSIASGATLAVVVQGQQRSDDAWVTLKENDGTTNLEFTAAKLADGAALEADGSLVGSLDLSRVDMETYKSVRIRATESGGAAVDIAATWYATSLRQRPSGQVDDLLSKQHPTVSAVVAAS